MEESMNKNNVDLAKVLNDSLNKVQAMRCKNLEIKWCLMDSEQRFYAATSRNNELQAELDAHLIEHATLLKELNDTKQKLKESQQMLKDQLERTTTIFNDESESVIEESYESSSLSSSSPSPTHRSVASKNIVVDCKEDSPATSRLWYSGGAKQATEEPIGFITKSPRTSFGSRSSGSLNASRSTSLSMIDEASVHQIPVSPFFSKVFNTPHDRMDKTKNVTTKVALMDLTNKPTEANISAKTINFHHTEKSSQITTNNKNECENDCIAKHRPTRQVAPKNLREPSLNQKLRRNF